MTKPRASKRLVRVIKIGNGRYVALARVLPFLQVGDIVEVEVKIQDEDNWTAIIRPSVIEVQHTVPPPRKR